MKVLAIDYGAKRIGLATCDELQLTTRGLATITSRGIKGDASTLAEIASKLECGAILVGLPLHLDGTRGRSAERAITFARFLRTRARCPVHLIDERLTSREADRQIPPRRRFDSKKSGARDQEAARIILEDFLRLGLGATVSIR